MEIIQNHYVIGLREIRSAVNFLEVFRVDLHINLDYLRKKILGSGRLEVPIIQRS